MQSKVISPEMISCGPMDISGILPVYKKYGETPLECLNRLRLKLPALKDALLSYAGRLDPLAEGIMLILVGKEFNRDRRSYLSLTKEYEVEILFGLSTDTGDILGMAKQADLRKESLDLETIKQTAQGFKGRQHFNYPVFSSRTVQGKPLFQWAKENRLHEIVIPKTDINIEDIKVTSVNRISSPRFSEHLKKSIGLITGDFRQKEIMDSWDNIFLNKIKATDDFVTCEIKVKCSSGSYMRTLSEEIGKRLGLPALAYSIRRTKIGDISVGEAYIIQ